MLLSRFLTNSRSNLLSTVALQQISRQLTPPISSQPYLLHHHFHQCNTVSDDSKKTGLLDKFRCVESYQQKNHLRKFIHGQSALNFKQSDEKNTKNDAKDKLEVEALIAEYSKLGLIARFKRMTKEYWYVLIPVHCFTSCFWFGGFYYASVCGVDIIGILENWNFPEKLINPLRDSHLGHIAVAYLCYKLATPARYTVTLGSTTFAIKKGMERGLIKPLPSKDQLVQMYKDKKDDIQQKVTDKTSEFKDKFKKDD